MFFQVLALGAGGGFLVQVDRDAQLAAHAAPQAAGDLHAVRHAHARDGHERHHVGGADAGVLAGVLVQVDQLGGFGDGAEGGFFHGCRRPDEGDHGAVVVQVRVAVEQAHLGDGGDRLGDRFDHFGAAGFGDIDDRFDKGDGHRMLGDRELGSEIGEQ